MFKKNLFIQFVISFVLLNFINSYSSNDFENTEIIRNIDLNNNIITFRTSITFKNKNISPLDSYTLILSQNTSQFLINFEITSYQKTIKYSFSKQDKNYLYYLIQFDSLKPEETLTIEIKEDYFDLLKFFPKKIKIKQSQYMLYEDSINTLSVYSTKSQTTLINLPKTMNALLSYTTENAHRSGNQLKYSLNDLNPFDYHPLSIHFENNKPFVVFNYANKTYQISHWGNIAIEEQYQIENIGAKLDGEFGRIDYDEGSRTGGKNALTEISAKLPLRAWGLWYRDEIGNISTSIAKREWNDVDLSLRPRFPILGGWKTNFGIGYNLPSKFHINSDGNGNYMLNLTFGMPFNDILAKDFSVEVDLPEGAYDVKLNLPIKGKYNIENKKVKGCLDLYGRNAIIIKLKNVYDIHKVNFQILYKYNDSNLYIKPIVVICYFFAIFLSLIVYMRADLSLNKNVKEKED